MANPATTAPAEEPRKKLTVPALQRERLNLVWAFLACIASVLAHAILVVLVMLVNFDVANADAGEVGNTIVEEELPEKKFDLTNLDLGIDTSVQTNYNVERIEEVSVPGMVNPNEAVGILNAPENAATTLPPPPGTGLGTGAALPSLDNSGIGSMVGTIGGMGGAYMPGGFGGRSGATREQMVREGGGNAESERAVALGLQWLALHQANDGSWSLTDYNATTRQKPLGQPGTVYDWQGGEKGTGRENKVAATAFAILPFLAAGQTHKPNKDNQIDYSRTVRAGLDYLIRQQKENTAKALRNPPAAGQPSRAGAFDNDFYAHGVATIAIGEAYGMTSDPMLKEAALLSIRYIVDSQHSEGGWRYSQRSPGDLSVVGWQIMGLKSCEMAGLAIRSDVMKQAERFVDSCQNDSSGWSYTPGGGGTPTMTAVGMLCKLYRGVGPRNPALQKGADILRKRPPAAAMSEYYYAYYATQVMHHMGADHWDFWNLGPSGKGTDGMRDLIVKAQDKGTNAKKKPQEGSWQATPSFHDGNSRVISTAMAMLSLEVYYRHLPLYRKDVGVMDKPKEMPAK